jgi:hypothetical protein
VYATRLKQQHRSYGSRKCASLVGSIHVHMNAAVLPGASQPCGLVDPVLVAIDRARGSGLMVLDLCDMRLRDAVRCTWLPSLHTA